MSKDSKPMEMSAMDSEDDLENTFEGLDEDLNDSEPIPEYYFNPEKEFRLTTASGGKVVLGIVGAITVLFEFIVIKAMFRGVKNIPLAIAFVAVPLLIFAGIFSVINKSARCPHCGKPFAFVEGHNPGIHVAGSYVDHTQKCKYCGFTVGNDNREIPH